MLLLCRVYVCHAESRVLNSASLCHRFEKTADKQFVYVDWPCDLPVLEVPCAATTDRHVTVKTINMFLEFPRTG